MILNASSKEDELEEKNLALMRNKFTMHLRKWENFEVLGRAMYRYRTRTTPKVQKSISYPHK